MEVAIRGRWSARGDTLRGAERARECQELKGKGEAVLAWTQNTVHTNIHTRVDRTSSYAETRWKKRTHAILRSLPRVLTVDVDFSLSKCRSRFSSQFQPTSEAAA